MASNLTISIAGAKEESEGLKKRIHEEAMRRGMSDSEWVVEAVAEHIRRQGGSSAR